jgi:hypothetical protein
MLLLGLVSVAGVRRCRPSAPDLAASPRPPHKIPPLSLKSLCNLLNPEHQATDVFNLSSLPLFLLVSAGVRVGYSLRARAIAMRALAMTVAMELLAPAVETFGSGEPLVFLDLAKLPIVSSLLLSRAPPLTVAPMSSSQSLFPVVCNLN